MMKTVEEILNEGGDVNIYFHRCENLEEAKKKIAPYKHLGKVVQDDQDGVQWVQVDNGKVKVTAFYKEGVLQHA